MVIPENDVSAEAVAFIDEEMTPADIAEVLEQLRFRGSGLRTIKIDKGCRDYLVGVLTARRAGKD
jgi:hypothetical protein